MAGRATILRPPPEDPDKAPIENLLEITELGVLGPDIFTNTRPQWHPPGARGIYGGAVIAQSIAAGQKTVPESFAIHSCHCYFLAAGSPSVPILYHVERVRDGRSFAARTVQARQRGVCIFTTTMSFALEGSGGEKQARHAAPLPDGVQPPPEGPDAGEWDKSSPYLSHKIEITGAAENRPIHERKCRQWVRARGEIKGGARSQVNALAYISDSWFIGTVTRVHRLWRYPFKPEDVPDNMKESVAALAEFEGMEADIESWKGRPELGMVVSLDHTIYFHDPRRIRADEWMLTEMDSPWAGEGRGLVMQRLFAEDGTLLATCVQEGVVRLKQDAPPPAAKL